MGKSSGKKRSRRGGLGREGGVHDDSRANGDDGRPVVDRQRRAPPRDERRGPRLALVVGVPAVVGAALFLPTLPNRLVYDDPGLFSYLRRLSGVSELFVGVPGGESYPVLSYLSVYLEGLIWGEWIPGFRITNLVLHGVCAGLVALAAVAVSRSRSVGLLAGLLFAVHPVHVEAVASIENRKELLAMAFAAGSLIAYQGIRQPVPRYLTTLVCVVGAVLSKAVAAVGLIVVLPAATFLLGAPDGKRRGLRSGVPVALVSLGLLVGIATAFAGPLTSFFAPQRIFVETEGLCRTYADVRTHSAGAVPEAVRLLVYPAQLNADYEGASTRRWRVRNAPLGAAMALVLLVALGSAVRFAPRVAFALLWMIVMYIPVSNLLPVSHFFTAERYLYVPSFGACLLLALGLDAAMRYDRGRLRMWVIAFVCVIIGAAGVRSAYRMLEWKNTLTFWSANVHVVSEASARANASLGLALYRNGQAAEAVGYLEKAVSMQPNHGGYRQVLQDAREKSQ